MEKPEITIPYTPFPTQAKFHQCNADEAVMGGSKGGGKLLDENTPIPTPSGFVPIKDIHPGDTIFGMDGKPYKVTSESEFVTDDAWELTFDDGSSVIAHDDHLWLTYNAKEMVQRVQRMPEWRERRRKKRPSKITGNKSEKFTAMMIKRNKELSKGNIKPPVAGTVRTTREIVDTLKTDKGWSNHAIPVCSALVLPEKDLPLDPYLLGLWLGDGTAREGSITTQDPQVVNSFLKAGFKIRSINTKPIGTASLYRFEGLREALIAVGVLNNKHVPHDYLWSSIEQRTALLQGLMDSDGTASGGSAEFSNTNKLLSEAVCHLIRSLGMKAKLRKKIVRLYGERKNDAWVVKWRPYMKVFRLPYKIEEQVIATSSTTKFRYIKKAKRLNSVTMKCLSVASPDRLFLCTEHMIPTHNSVSLVMEALAYGLEYAGATIYLFRETYDDLEANLIAEWKRRVPPELYTYHGSKYVATLINGTQIFFRYVRSKADAEGYDGRSIDWLGIDELTKHEPASIQILLSCVRSAKGFPPRFRGTCNPGGPGHCIPYGEVMTPQGWVDIKDMKIGDKVYAVDEQGSLVISKVGQVHKHIYEGDLWRARARGLEMICTPEHRIAKAGGVRVTKKPRDYYNGRVCIDCGKEVGKNRLRCPRCNTIFRDKYYAPVTFSLVAAKDLPGQAGVLRAVEYIGKAINEFSVPLFKTRKRKHDQPVTLSGNCYAEFMGWFLSEGYVVLDEKQKRFGISQMKSEYRPKIEDLLDRCGFIYNSNDQGYTVFAPDWWAYLKRFGKCRDKHVPRKLLNASKDQLRLFFNAAMDGDGTWHNRNKRNSGVYHTISKQLADDMAEVAVKLGYSVYTSFRYREDREGPTYSVNFKPNKTTELLTGQHKYNVDTVTQKDKNVDAVPYSSTVYDIGVEKYHTFVLRQNGSVWISGNSYVKNRYIDPTNKGKKQYTDKETGNKIAFIPSKVYDNLALMEHDPSYVRRLENLPPKKRAAYLHGDWDVYDGQAFEEFDPSIHVVKPFRIPEHWYKWRSMDNGYSDPFATYWLTVDERGIVYIYREFTRDYGDPRLTYTQQAQKIVELSKYSRMEHGQLYEVDEIIGPTYCGHDAFATHPMAPGKTIAWFYQQSGLFPLQPAATDRKLRKGVWHEYLKPIELTEPDPYTGRMTIAKVQIFDTCTRLIETLPMQMEDENDPEKVADSSYNHQYDGAGYGLVAYHMGHSSYVELPKKKLPFELRSDEPSEKDALQEYLWC